MKLSDRTTEFPKLDRARVNLLFEGLECMCEDLRLCAKDEGLRDKVYNMTKAP